MKIKKAIKKAAEHNHKWITVDMDCEIYSYVQYNK